MPVSENLKPEGNFYALPVVGEFDPIQEDALLFPGITFLDYAALSIMGTMFCKGKFDIDPEAMSVFASKAYDIAEALLTERNKRKVEKWL